MDKITGDGFEFSNYGRINILLGRNGCGKSILLRKIYDSPLRDLEIGKKEYIAPERGGTFPEAVSVEESRSHDEGYLKRSPTLNYVDNFRGRNFVKFRDLEVAFYRELEGSKPLRNDLDHSFLGYIKRINDLLDDIEIRPGVTSFDIYKKNTDNKIAHHVISSGEAELISLGIECLFFERECHPDKLNILLLDEPDVHLHPDLQSKLMHFLKDMIENGKNIYIFIATHSTAILGALENYNDVCFEFMRKGQGGFNFKKVQKEYSDIIPIFGAHPLSTIYCSMPIFLVEGEDDVWIWQKAVRTAEGMLKVFPCSTDGLGNMHRYEKMVSQMICSIYDSSSVVAYSLRDRDDRQEDNNLDDFDKIKRFTLNCRASENLLLSDDVLGSAQTTWLKLTKDIDGWLKNENNFKHHSYKIMLDFQKKYDRKMFNIKEIANILVGMITTKPWQIAVGQQIGQLVRNIQKSDLKEEHSLVNYLGDNLIRSLSRHNS